MLFYVTHNAVQLPSDNGAILSNSYQTIHYLNKLGSKAFAAVNFTDLIISDVTRLLNHAKTTSAGSSQYRRAAALH